MRALPLLLAVALAGCQPAPGPGADVVGPAPTERLDGAPGVDPAAPVDETRLRPTGTVAGVRDETQPSALDGTAEGCAAAYGVTVVRGVPQGTPANLASYQSCVAARTR